MIAQSSQVQSIVLSIAGKLRASVTLTTRAIMLEIGNALAKLRYRQAAISLLSSLENDPNVEIIPASDDLYRE